MVFDVTCSFVTKNWNCNTLVQFVAVTGDRVEQSKFLCIYDYTYMHQWLQLQFASSWQYAASDYTYRFDPGLPH